MTQVKTEVQRVPAEQPNRFVPLKPLTPSKPREPPQQLHSRNSLSPPAFNISRTPSKSQLRQPPQLSGKSSSPRADRAGRESPPPHPPIPYEDVEADNADADNKLVGDSGQSPSPSKGDSAEPSPEAQKQNPPAADVTDSEPSSHSSDSSSPDSSQRTQPVTEPTSSLKIGASIKIVNRDGPLIHPANDVPVGSTGVVRSINLATDEYRVEYDGVVHSFSRHNLAPHIDEETGNAVTSKSSTRSPSTHSTQTIRVKVHIRTEFLKDTLCILIRHAADLDLFWFLTEIKRRYDEWHDFKVYDFSMARFRHHQNPEWIDRGADPEEGLLACFDIDKKKKHSAIECFVYESDGSKKQREEDQRREEEERQRQEEERKRLEAIKQARIKELKLKGECWMLQGFANALDVPIEDDGMVVVNRGSLDQWVTVRYVRAVRPTKKFYYAVRLDKLPYTSNSWKICIGYVPISFKLQKQRHWVGAQKSWSYIAGTGGKCHDSGKSIPYGEKYAEGDVIGSLVDFEEGTIEFFKNNVSQGIAFRNVKGAVYPAVSVTATDSRTRLVDTVPEAHANLMSDIRLEEQRRRERWSTILSLANEEKQISAFADSGVNSWAAKVSMEKDEALWYPDTGPVVDTVVNEGSDDKWRSTRAVGAYDSGQHLFEFIIKADCKTTNTWRVGMGIVPTHFSAAADRAWVGAQRSWVYISGTGGKCYNKGKSEAYGEACGKGDRVGVLLDFDKGEIEFFLNGETQGIAFTNLVGPVHPAVSMTGTGTTVQILPTEPGLLEKYRERAMSKVAELTKVTSLYGNVWDTKKLSADMNIDDHTSVVCTSKTNKWRAAASMIQYASGRRYFEVIVDKLPSTSNSWRICVGVVTKDFSFKHQKLWIGSKFSWSYIGGTGGKCHVGAKTESYGQKYGKGDRIGVLMDFDNRTLEFYKNDIPQGDAFTDLSGPVYAAVSVTGFNTRVILNAKAEQEKMADYALYF